MKDYYDHIKEVYVRPDLYGSKYTVVHNIRVYLTWDEINNAEDLTKTVLERANTLYNTNDYIISFGRREKSCFGVSYHVHLLKEMEK